VLGGTKEIVAVPREFVRAPSAVKLVSLVVQPEAADVPDPRVIVPTVVFRVKQSG
jgi:hypothetical protein